LLYASLAPLNDPDPAEALLKFCQALCAPLQPLYELVRERADGTPSWGILFDANNCPAERLSYLAQYPGVQLTPEMDAEQKRAEISEPTGWTRGRIPSVVVAGQRHLTGTKRVVIHPRTPSAGHLYMRTLKSETPDEAVTLADILTQKPAWELLDYEAFEGFTFTDLEVKYATVAGAEAAYATLDDAITDTP
jgi:hypothetical protein